MGEALAVPRGCAGSTARPLLTALGVAAGVGVGGALAGAAFGRGSAELLRFFGTGYADFWSVTARVLLAAAFVAAGAALASLDRIPFAPGVGAVTGAFVGAIFAAVSWTGLAWALVAGAVAGGLAFAMGLTQMPALTRRELNSLFYTPIAYVVATVFLFFFGLFQFFQLAYPRGEAEVSLSNPVNLAVSYMLPIICPVLTMRLLAEEKRQGTMETLMTAPVTDWEVVGSKFLASLAAFSAMLAPTFVHVLTLYLVSERGPAVAPLVGSYFGMTLTAVLFLSLGLLASALSRDQIVAAIIAFSMNICVFLLGALEAFSRMQGWFGGNEKATKFFEFISYWRHIENFNQGMIETRSVVFLLSLSFFVLFLTVRVVESRKWR